MQWPPRSEGEPTPGDPNRPDDGHQLDDPATPADPHPHGAPGTRPGRRTDGPPALYFDYPEPKRARPVSRALGIVAVVFALLVVLAVSPLAIFDAKEIFKPQKPTTPVRPVIEPRDYRPPRPTEETPVVWSQTLEELRPDLKDGRIESTPDGFSDSHRIIGSGDTWAIITRDDKGRGNVIHGLDPLTGDELWARPMDGAYCAEPLLDGHLACAEVTSRKRGLGTEWVLHLINPATGASARQAPFSGWLTAVTVDHHHLVILEQRLPAPHAVVTGFDANLAQAWQIDLSEYPLHDSMFSTNRIIYRAEKVPKGPALLRPRVRRVADGLAALSMGAATVFLDVRGGRVAEVTHCGILVDDGERLWCTTGDRVVASDYRLAPLAHTEPGIFLAFPYQDPRAPNITIPAFIDERGVVVDVDPTTGETVGDLVYTAMGDAFGLGVPPKAVTLGGVLLVSDQTATVALGPDGERLWRAEYAYSLRGSLLHDEKFLIVDYSGVFQLDPATGDIEASWRTPLGMDLTPVGDTLAAAGFEAVARLDLE